MRNTQHPWSPGSEAEAFFPSSRLLMSASALNAFIMWCVPGCFVSNLHLFVFSVDRNDGVRWVASPPSATGPEKFSRREGVGVVAPFLSPAPTERHWHSLNRLQSQAADSLHFHLSQQRENQRRSALRWRRSVRWWINRPVALSALWLFQAYLESTALMLRSYLSPDNKPPTVKQ